MGIKFLWDTNIAIYYLQQQLPIHAEKVIDQTLETSAAAISVISEIELLCWRTPNENDLQILHRFISDAFVYELDHAIKTKTAEIRRAHRIKLPDAIIAATAIIYNLTLLTRNTSDFASIDELSILDPIAL